MTRKEETMPEIKPKTPIKTLGPYCAPSGKCPQWESTMNTQNIPQSHCKKFGTNLVEDENPDPKYNSVQQPLTIRCEQCFYSNN